MVSRKDRWMASALSRLEPPVLSAAGLPISSPPVQTWSPFLFSPHPRPLTTLHGGSFFLCVAPFIVDINVFFFKLMVFLSSASSSESFLLRPFLPVTNHHIDIATRLDDIVACSSAPQTSRGLRISPDEDLASVPTGNITGVPSIGFLSAGIRGCGIRSLVAINSKRIYSGVSSMPALKKRLGASIFLSVLSLVSIVLLLPSSRVSTQLQKIGLPTSIDHYWNWGQGGEDEEDEEDVADGVRLVVFGDSWVEHSPENAQSGKGKSYVEVLCEELNCTSCLNYASSQPASDFPAKPPTGVLTSNLVHAAAIANTQAIPAEAVPKSSLPDFIAQIKTYTELAMPKTMPLDTIFVLSFGFWDIYDFAQLDYELSKKTTEDAVNILFTGLDVLYQHFTATYNSIKNETVHPTNTSLNFAHQAPPSFHVIIPKIFDPTLLPGWISQRPLPLSPSSVAEQHKNAVYLTDRWNSAMEQKMTVWVKNFVPKKEEAKPQTPNDPNLAYSPKPPVPAGVAHPYVREPAASRPVKPTPTPSPTSTPIPEEIIEKDIIYYDLPGLLLDLIIEHQLEDEGLHDAAGLGKGESPFESVYQPCVREAETIDTDGYVDLNGMLVCNEPEEYLWWDYWGLGKVAKEMIGKEIAEMVKEGRTLKDAWAEAKKNNGH